MTRLTDYDHDQFLTAVLSPGALTERAQLEAHGWFVSNRVHESDKIVLEHADKPFALVHTFAPTYRNPDRNALVDWKKCEVVQAFTIRISQ